MPEHASMDKNDFNENDGKYLLKQFTQNLKTKIIIINFVNRY